MMLTVIKFIIISNVDLLFFLLKKSNLILNLLSIRLRNDKLVVNDRTAQTNQRKSSEQI